MDPDVRRERIEARWEETQEQAKVIASWGFPLWRIANALD